MPSVVRRVTKLLAMALSELEQVKSASHEVLRDWMQKLVEYIVLKYKCMKIKEKMCKVKNHSEWEEYARVLD